MGDESDLSVRASILARRMKETAGARFNAARRLEFKVKSFSIIVMVLSCLILALTVLPYILRTPQAVTDLLNFLTIASAIFMLGASIFQNSSLNSVNAEQHHRSALEINEIRRLIEFYPTVRSEEDIHEITIKYNNVSQKYSINHDDIDHQKFMAERPDQYPFLSSRERAFIKMKVFILHYSSIIALTVTLILICVTVYLVV